MINSENLTFRLYLEKDMVFDSAPESGISADGVKAIFKDKAGKMYFALPQQLASMVEAATFYLSSNDVDQEKVNIPKGWSLEGASPCAWLTEDLSSSGIIGDASSSNPVLGAALENALIDHWKSLFASLLSSDWPPVKS